MKCVTFFFFSFDIAKQYMNSAKRLSQICVLYKNFLNRLLQVWVFYGWYPLLLGYRSSDSSVVVCDPGVREETTSKESVTER